MPPTGPRKAWQRAALSDRNSFLNNDLVGDTGLEHPSETPEKLGVTAKRGTESGTLGGDLGFADAVAAVMRLPLSDAEKAEAVRRLLQR